MLIRIREWRNYMESRIREIEAGLHLVWRDGAAPLDIRTLRHWAERRPKFNWYNWPTLPFYLAFRNASASLVLLLLPLAFAGVWIVLLLTGAHRSDLITEAISHGTVGDSDHGVAASRWTISRDLCGRTPGGRAA